MDFASRFNRQRTRRTPSPNSWQETHKLRYFSLKGIIYFIRLIEFIRNSIYNLIKTFVLLRVEFAGIGRGRDFLEKRTDPRSPSCTCGKRFDISQKKQDFSNLFAPPSLLRDLGASKGSISFHV